MTNVKFTFPVQDITGKVDEGHNLSFRTRYGKTHAYHYVNKSGYQPKSAAQIAQQQLFNEANQKAKAELQIPERFAYWQTQFKKQKKYVRLDRFVAAMIRKGENLVE